MNRITSCNELPTKRQREICEGTANIPLDGKHSINAYRKSWGLLPLGNVAEAQPDQWNVSMPSRGLGDTIAKLTHATGIDTLVKAVSGKKDCGCKKRQKILNDVIPFR